jgi:hypothetical protein
MKYGMFTEQGNARVHQLVMSARREGWSWTQTENYLRILAKHVPECREAADTVVREAVYSATQGEHA